MLQPGFDPFPWRELSPQPVIGVDEVGRGCLAGPVYAGAVIIPPDFETSDLTDSKKLSEKERERLSSLIFAACPVGLGFATVQEIEEINILWASLLAMKRAVESLQQRVAHVLVDGHKKIPQIPFKQIPLVKGDLRAEPIAAASIVAKVCRDRLMRKLGEKYPGYGFREHKGYGTLKHRQVIKEKGPLEIHRSGFAGVKEYLSKKRSSLRGSGSQIF